MKFYVSPKPADNQSIILEDNQLDVLERILTIKTVSKYVITLTVFKFQNSFTSGDPFMEYSFIIHSVLSPFGARPIWKTSVLFVPITSEEDLTSRSFPVAFQYPILVVLLFCEPCGYFLPRGQKKNHSVSDLTIDLSGKKKNRNVNYLKTLHETRGVKMNYSS